VKVTPSPKKAPDAGDEKELLETDPVQTWHSYEFTLSHVLMVFFFRISLVVLKMEINNFRNFHNAPPVVEFVGLKAIVQLYLNTRSGGK